MKDRNYSKAHSLPHTPICLILGGYAHILAPLNYCEALKYVKGEKTFKYQIYIFFLVANCSILKVHMAAYLGQ